MKNKTLQDNKKHKKVYGFDLIKRPKKTLDAKDYVYLLNKNTKEEQKKYWSRTSMTILFFVILIIYLYHFA